MAKRQCPSPVKVFGLRIRFIEENRIAFIPAMIRYYISDSEHIQITIMLYLSWGDLWQRKRQKYSIACHQFIRLQTQESWVPRLECLTHFKHQDGKSCKILIPKKPRIHVQPNYSSLEYKLGLGSDLRKFKEENRSFFIPVLLQHYVSPESGDIVQIIVVYLEWTDLFEEKSFFGRECQKFLLIQEVPVDRFLYYV